MKLLPEESLRLRACMQLKEDALTKVLPLIARTRHLPYLFWSWACIISHRTFCRCHDPFSVMLGGTSMACPCARGATCPVLQPGLHVPNAFSVFSGLWLHHSSVVPGLKGSQRINQHAKCLPKEEKVFCRYSGASYFGWCSKAIPIFLFLFNSLLNNSI